MLDADPLTSKMDSAERAECISGALRCGLEVAQNLLDVHERQAPLAMAEKMRLKVTEVALPPTRVVLSTFDSASSTISLNSAMLSIIGAMMEKYGISEFLGPVTPKEVVICHELFHCVESREEALFSNHHKRTLWKFGPFSYKSTIPAVSEIGAMACAESLCRLAVSPLLLDMLALQGKDPRQAQLWFDKLKQSRP